MWLSKQLYFLLHFDSHISYRCYINASPFKHDINIYSQKYLFQWHKASTTWAESKHRFLSDLELLPRAEYSHGNSPDNQGQFLQLSWFDLGMLWYSAGIWESKFSRLPSLLYWLHPGLFAGFFSIPSISSCFVFYSDSYHYDFLQSRIEKQISLVQNHLSISYCHLEVLARAISNYVKKIKCLTSHSSSSQAQSAWHWCPSLLS